MNFLRKLIYFISALFVHAPDLNGHRTRAVLFCFWSWLANQIDADQNALFHVGKGGWLSKKHPDEPPWGGILAIINRQSVMETAYSALVPGSSLPSLYSSQEGRDKGLFQWIKEEFPCCKKAKKKKTHKRIQRIKKNILYKYPRMRQNIYGGASCPPARIMGRKSSVSDRWVDRENIFLYIHVYAAKGNRLIKL